MNKRIIATALAGLVAFAMVGCSNSGGAGGTTSTSNPPASGTSTTASSSSKGIPNCGTIGVAMPNKTSSRWVADGNAVKSQLEALGCTVDLQYAADDIPTQTQQLDQMITNGVKLLIIASIDGTALTAQLQAAADKGIKVIAYDRLINGTPNVDFYVTFDNYKVGVAQAKSLLYGLKLTDKDGNPAADAPKGPIDIELFAGAADDNNSGFFFNGAMDTLKPYLDNGTLVVKSGQTKFEQVATERWLLINAQTRMDNLLSSTYGGNGAGLKGVLAPYDGLSRGIINALTNVGMGPTIPEGLPIVTGQDAEIESVALINKDIQFSTIFKDTRKLAAQAVTVSQAYLSGGTPEANDTKTYDNGKKIVPSYLLDVDTVNKDNIKPLLIDSGYWTQQQVDSGQP